MGMNRFYAEMSSFSISSCSVPAALTLISFLSFSSQTLFFKFEPLNLVETVVFNVSIAFLLICYARAIITDPGRIKLIHTGDDSSKVEMDRRSASKSRQRWCLACEQRKPSRAHHCKRCKRCIAKMDHHCPWTNNCVSHRTYPHFIRFVFYSVSSMSILEYFLIARGTVLFKIRDLPSYRGPSVVQLTHLFILIVVNSITLISLALLLSNALWSLAWNMSTIEAWELDRHEALLRRARVSGGYLDGPDGMKIRIKRQEYPYDIGIWQNFKQGMGSGNILAWFWPFSATPNLSDGIEFETNGMEDPSIGWPPPDPDRIPRMIRPYERQEHSATELELSSGNEVEQFRSRQHADYLRRRQPFHKRYDEQSIRLNGTAGPSLYVGDTDEHGEESWKNTEGEGLADFGADEEAEFYDEDVPLAVLLERRKPTKA